MEADLTGALDLIVVAGFQEETEFVSLNDLLRRRMPCHAESLVFASKVETFRF